MVAGEGHVAEHRVAAVALVRAARIGRPVAEEVHVGDEQRPALVEEAAAGGVVARAVGIACGDEEAVHRRGGVDRCRGEDVVAVDAFDVGCLFGDVIAVSVQVVLGDVAAEDRPVRPAIALRRQGLRAGEAAQQLHFVGHGKAGRRVVAVAAQTDIRVVDTCCNPSFAAAAMAVSQRGLQRGEGRRPSHAIATRIRGVVDIVNRADVAATVIVAVRLVGIGDGGAVVGDVSDTITIDVAKDGEGLGDLGGRVVVGIARLIGGDGAGADGNAGHGAAADRAEAGGLRGEGHRIAGVAASRRDRAGAVDDDDGRGAEAERLAALANGDVLRRLGGRVVVGVARLVGGDGASPRRHAGDGTAADGANAGCRRTEGDSVAGRTAGRRNRAGSADHHARRGAEAEGLAALADGDVLRHLSGRVVVNAARLVGGDGASPRRHAGHGAAADRANACGLGGVGDGQARRGRGGNRAGPADHHARRGAEADGLVGFVNSDVLRHLRRGVVAGIARLVGGDGASACRHAGHQGAADGANAGRL